MSDAPPRPRGAMVWDLPTRLFHWLLALTVIGAWLTGEGRAGCMSGLACRSWRWWCSG
ncbi:hypothetical protein ACFQ4K_16945 [Tistrella bauzanensis]